MLMHMAWRIRVRSLLSLFRSAFMVASIGRE